MNEEEKLQEIQSLRSQLDLHLLELMDLEDLCKAERYTISNLEKRLEELNTTPHGHCLRS